jgi:hypothetical protein
MAGRTATMTSGDDSIGSDIWAGETEESMTILDLDMANSCEQ